MAFDAADPGIVPLDYNFTKYVEGAKGTTPEPTEDMIYEFQAAVRDQAALLDRGHEVDPEKPESVIKFMRSLTKEDRKKLTEKTFEALAALTQGQPSYDEMMELNKASYRVAQAYVGSIIGDILNPKGSM